MKFFNYQKLWKRLLTIIVYSPIVIAAVYLGGIPFFMMVFLFAFLSVQEMSQMYLLKYKKVADQLTAGMVFAALALTSAYMQEFSWIWQNKLLLVVVFATVIYFHIELIAKKIFFPQNQALFTLRVILYVGLMFPFFILLRNAANGLNYIIYLVAVVWTNDSFAYLIGLPLGRHKLSPEISPKKSIEGAIGAAFGAVLMSVNIRLLINADIAQAILGGLAISILAQTGDLIESLLKRELQAKDSGDLFPGHGGILDRLDSFILTIPVFYIFVHYVLK